MQLLHENSKVKEILNAIREIDPDKNGYVTSTELEDIFKHNYKDELYGFSLTNIMKPFESAQNCILIDHKKFKVWLF